MRSNRSGETALGVMRRLERAAVLGPAVSRPTHVVEPLASSPFRPLLLGNWLGHSFHPLLTDFVEGPWMAASFLDLFGPKGSSLAARRLLEFGLIMAIPTHLSGLAEWVTTKPVSNRRVGLVHSTAASVATVLYAASYLNRRRGKDSAGKLLGLCGGVIAYLTDMSAATFPMFVPWRSVRQ